MIPKIDRHKGKRTHTHTLISSITFLCYDSSKMFECMCMCSMLTSQIKSNILYGMTPDVWRCNAYYISNFYLRWTQIFVFIFLLSPIYYLFFWDVCRISEFILCLFMFILIQNALKIDRNECNSMGFQRISANTHKTITSFIVALAMNHAVVNGVFRYISR